MRSNYSIEHAQAPEYTSRFRRFTCYIFALFTLTIISHQANAQNVTAPLLPQQLPQQVLFIGDSITAGYGIDKELAYPQLIEEAFRKEGYIIRVINGGLSGDTTAGGLRRVRWLLKNTTPSLIVVALGANDMLRGLPVQEMTNNLRTILALLSELAPQASLVLIGMKAAPNMGREYSAAYNKSFKEVADSIKVTYIDFLLEGVAGRSDRNLPDGIHPNELGHRTIAERLIASLRPLLRGTSPR
jgi:acyl-CoA thioesterase-1